MNSMKPQPMHDTVSTLLGVAVPLAALAREEGQNDPTVRLVCVRASIMVAVSPASLA